MHRSNLQRVMRALQLHNPILVDRCGAYVDMVITAMEEAYVEEMQSLLQPSTTILDMMEAMHRASNHVSFECIDGSLIDAIVLGYWVVFDNVNFCNACVLDRLNSFLENDGFVLINECVLVDGKDRIIYPHNNFRIFFVMNPLFGEICCAMRNRCVELFFSPSSSCAVQEAAIVKCVDATTWDELDIVNSFLFDDLHLILVILQTFADIGQLFRGSVMRINTRYLHRLAGLTAEQFERGESVEASVGSAVSSVFNHHVVL